MNFGFFKGLPYNNCNESFDTYRSFVNKVPKTEIIKHLKNVEFGLTSLPTADFFTGEKLHAGMCWDGEFTFPYEFLHYYENYDIGIPFEYEKYLTETGALNDG